ncbi:hypothetical protein APS67_006043 [Streptomyces sp. AVP053U2]|nr:hypothetical protein APS67_006043 [Streptomyces sp. AVP053U2]
MAVRAVAFVLSDISFLVFRRGGGRGAGHPACGRMRAWIRARSRRSRLSRTRPVLATALAVRAALVVAAELGVVTVTGDQAGGPWEVRLTSGFKRLWSSARPGDVDDADVALSPRGCEHPAERKPAW